MGRKRTINRKEQMAFEDDDKEREDQEEEETDEDEEASDADDDADADGDDDGGDDDEDAPKKKAKPKKKVAKPAAAKPKRTRTPKVVRMRAFWGVFSNNNAMVAKFDYNKKDEAEAHAAKLRTDKGGTFFVMQQKEPLEV